jgi:hypothetical protein
VIVTSVYIGHWESGLYDEALERVRRGFVGGRRAASVERSGMNTIGIGVNAETSRTTR